MLAIFKLLFNYWKRSYSWIFSFILPLFTLAIFHTFTPTRSLLPNFIISTSLASGVFGLAIIYSDLKNSVIMKKIRTLPLPRWKVVGGIVGFNTLISLAASLWIFGMGSLFYRSEINFSQISWFFLILAAFLATLLGSLFGFLIGSIAPDFRTAGNLAFFINMPSNFLAGIYVPMSLMKNKAPVWLLRTAKIFPYSSPVSIANHAFSPSNLAENNLLFSSYWVPITISLAWIGGLFLLNFIIYKFSEY